MVFGLPTPGEPNWDVKLDASIEAVKATADAAQPAASLEAAVAGKIGTDGALDSALTGSYATLSARPLNAVQQFDVVPDASVNQKLKVQSALDAAGAAGATVEFPPGIYFANELVVPEFVTIQGVGGSTARHEGSEGRMASVIFRQIAGSSSTVMELAGAASAVENIMIDGNGAAGTLLKRSGFETRMREVRLYNGTGIGLLDSQVNNGLAHDVSVDNCGSSTLPAVRLTSTDPETSNTVNLDWLQIERSANTALEIAMGSTTEQYAEFLRIIGLHIEAPTDGTPNTAALVRIGNVRNVDLIAPFIYGGPGALLSHEYDPLSTRGNVDGGVRVLGGTLLGRKDDPNIPDYLVELVTGEFFAFIGTEFDSCGIAALRVGSDYGAQVVIDPACVFTSRVPSAIADNRTTYTPARHRGDQTFTRDITVNRHLLTGEGKGRAFTTTSGIDAPGNTSQARDRLGHVTFGTTASPPAAGELMRMTFSSAYAEAPQAIIGARNAATQALGLYAKCSTTQMIVYSASAPAASQASGTYEFSWVVES